jgi:hypothetical protein
MVEFVSGGQLLAAGSFNLMKQVKTSPIALLLGFLGILLLEGCSGGSGNGPTNSTVSTPDGWNQGR